MSRSPRVPPSHGGRSRCNYNLNLRKIAAKIAECRQDKIRVAPYMRDFSTTGRARVNRTFLACF
jgi:hypothetical protein